jgi:hypothetical protein
MGSSKKQTVGYKYFMGLHFGVCQGPIDALLRIVCGDRVAWTGSQTTSGTVEISAPDLFGGDEREGGVQGTLDVMMGGDTQTANAYLASVQEGTQPSYRGVLSAVFRRGFVGSNNPYIKPWAFTVRRILSGWFGGSAWYPEKAPIGEITVTPAKTLIQSYFSSTPTSQAWENISAYSVNESGDFDAVTDGTGFSINSSTTEASKSLIFSGVTANGSDALTFEFFVTVQQTPNVDYTRCARLLIGFNFFDFGFYGANRNAVLELGVYSLGHEYGALGSGVSFPSGQRTHVSLQLTSGGLYLHISGQLVYSIPGFLGYLPNGAGISLELTGAGYTGQAAAIFTIDSFRVRHQAVYGPANFQAPNMIPAPDQAVSSGVISMNPAHIVYQCLTDPEWGMGYSSAIIDDAGFRAAADVFHAEGLGLCLHWTQQQTIDAFVQTVMDHAGAVLRQDLRTGLFTIKPMRADYDAGALPLFDESNIRSLDSFDRAGSPDAVNEITVRYDDADTGKPGSVTVQNLAAVTAVGGVVARSVSYPGLPTAALAGRVAMRDLRALSTPLARVRMRTNRAGYDVLPGDVIRIAWPKLGISQLVLRVARAKPGSLTDGEVEIEAVEDVFGLGASAYVAQQPPGWQEPSTQPQPIATRAVIEAPYYELQRELSAADLAALPADAGYLLVGASRPGGAALNFRIATRPAGAGSYEEAGTGDFCATGTLAGALSYTATAATLATVSSPSLIEAGTYALLGPEIVRVDAYDAGTNALTLGRGVLDTVATTHAAGATIFFMGSINASDNVERVGGEAVDVKLLTAAGGGTIAVGAAAADTVTFVGRAARPYPPGRLRVNNEAYPASVTAPLVISWSHRNRLQQNLEGDETGNIGPEPGTAYSIMLRNASTGQALASASGITGTSYTPASPLLGDINILATLRSSRGGLDSLQQQSHTFRFISAAPGVTLTASASFVAGDAFAILQDPFFESVALLLHMDGANGSTTFLDSSVPAKVVTTFGGAQISTAQSKFGGAAGYFDGNGDYLQTGANSSLALLGVDFTIEFWVYRVGAAAGYIVNQDDGNSNSQNWQLLVGSFVQWTSFSTSSRSSFWVLNTGAGSVPLSQWTHIAVVRAGSATTIYINGNSAATSTNTYWAGATLPTAINNWITGVSQTAANAAFNGYLDDLRISKGVARYTAGFTPPTAPFPDGDVVAPGALLPAAASLIPAAAYVSVTLLQPSSGPTAGNRQTIFYDWTGWPSGDAAFNPAKPITFNFLIRKRGATEGAPDAVNFTAAMTFNTAESVSPSLVDERIAFGGSGESTSVAILGAGAGVYARRRTDPEESGWCETFSTRPAKWQYVLVFPQGQRVWLRNPEGSPLAAFNEWEIYGYTIPGDTAGGRPYFEATVALDLSQGENFVVATDVGQPQVIRVNMPPGAPPTGATYAVTLGGVVFSTTVGSGQTSASVASALAALIDASANYSAFAFGAALQVTGQPNVAYTYEFSVT